MQSSQVKAGLAHPDDIDSILALNIQEYGPEDILTTPADFAWRRDQNPAGTAHIPVIRNKAGKVVGFIWVVPLRMRIRGKTYQAATGTNLVIHPSYRNTFGYVKLIRRFEQVFKEEKIPLHFSFISEASFHQAQNRPPNFRMTARPNANRQQPQLRTPSFKISWIVPLLVKPFNVEKLAHIYFAKGWKRFVGRYMSRLISPFMGAGRSHIPLDSRIKVEEVEKFDGRFDQFWDQVQDRYPVMVIRNGTFLRWRFANLSGRDYRILVGGTANQMLGYLVLRCATVRGIKTGLIVDYLINNSESGRQVGAYLLTEAERLFRERGMLLAMNLSSSFTKEYQLLRQLGYRYVPAFISPRPFRFATFLHDTSDSTLTSLSAKDWFITIADYESF